MDKVELIRILSADFPEPIWYVPSIVLVILAAVSVADARTGRVPDVPLAIGVMIAICSLAWYSGWLVAGERLLYVVAAVYALRLANNVYHRLFQHDAFGFGDAKWTGLAVAGFGLAPVAGAWIVAAWVGLLWMGMRRVWRRVSNAYAGHEYVHFAPFLFVGLLVALFRNQVMDLITAFIL